MMTIARDLILNHHYHHPSIERSFNRLIPLHTCSLPLSSLASFRVRVLYKNKILAATTSTLSLSFSLYAHSFIFNALSKIQMPPIQCPFCEMQSSVPLWSTSFLIILIISNRCVPSSSSTSYIAFICPSSFPIWWIHLDSPQIGFKFYVLIHHNHYLGCLCPIPFHPPPLPQKRILLHLITF